MDSSAIGTPAVDAPVDTPPVGPQTGSNDRGNGPPEGTGHDSPDRLSGAQGDRFSHRTRVILGVLVALVLMAAVAMRFWTISDLWLDEALTVNIARLPLHDLPAYLKRDGAPPLYYVLLHYWMGIFGTSDLGVRSLSGVMGVVTIPLVWLAGKRLGGRVVGFAAMLLVATSPFAVRYDTENRMYAMVALLTVLGFLAIDRVLQRPRPGNLIAVGVVTGLLLYSQYWALYLVGVVFLWLAYQAWRGPERWRRTARPALVAMFVGSLTFLPWVPTFIFQSQHTGTPWSTPANFAGMVNAITTFAGGGTNQGRALALIYFGLCGLGLFGIAVNRRHIDLDIRTRPLGRPVTIVIVGTLAAAIAGGYLSKSAFDARYASVVFVPLILLVALGVTTFLDLRVRTWILVAAVLAGLFGSIPDITTNRTQAGQVSRALNSQAHAGDIVAYCPDQLGPAVARLLPSGRYQQITFPRDTGPTYVNWVDYAAATHKASALAFAQRLEQMAGSNHAIFIVWAPGYQAFGNKCQGIIDTIQADPHYNVTDLVGGNTVSFYQPMYLTQFEPTKP